MTSTFIISIIMSQARLQVTQAANTIPFPKWINKKVKVLELL